MRRCLSIAKILILEDNRIIVVRYCWDDMIVDEVIQSDTLLPCLLLSTLAQQALHRFARD